MEAKRTARGGPKPSIEDASEPTRNTNSIEQSSTGEAQGQ